MNLRNFPTGTTYSKSGNTVQVKILKKNIKDDINGTIDIVNARVKTCPAFYAEAKNDDYQDYVIAADPMRVHLLEQILKLHQIMLL